MSIAPSKGSPIFHTSQITLATWVVRYLHEHSRIQTDGIPYYDIRNPRMKWDTSIDISLQPVSVTCEAQMMVRYPNEIIDTPAPWEPLPIPLFMVECLPYSGGRSKMVIDICDRLNVRQFVPTYRSWLEPYLDRLRDAADAEWGTPTLTAEVPGPMPVDDPTDQRILAMVKDDPDLTDTEIAQKLNLSRQAVSARRMRLKAMGYTVR